MVADSHLHRLPVNQRPILVIPDPMWAQDQEQAENSVDWLTYDIPPEDAAKLLQCLAFNNMVYHGAPGGIFRRRKGFQALLLHEKVLMWYWLKKKGCLVKFISFGTFLKYLAKPSTDYPRQFAEYICVWGGVDLMVDPRGVAPGLETWEKVQKYVQCLSLLRDTVPVWPPPPECQQAAHKLVVIHQLDQIANTVTHSPRPVTTLWHPEAQIPLADVVLKREGSDCGRHVYLDPTVAPEATVVDEASFAWFTQTRVETLRSVGEWRLVMADMQVVYVVNTMPMEMKLSETFYSQRTYGLSLEDMSERMRRPFLQDDIMDPQDITVEAGQFANQELEEFAVRTLRKLVELEEDEGCTPSSLRLSARLDLGVLRDENGRLGYFVNEVERGVATALYARTRPQNVLCYADTYYPPFREWVLEQHASLYSGQR